jgi:hypothetical protein
MTKCVINASSHASSVRYVWQDHFIMRYRWRTTYTLWQDHNASPQDRSRAQAMGRSRAVLNRRHRAHRASPSLPLPLYI